MPPPEHRGPSGSCSHAALCTDSRGARISLFLAALLHFLLINRAEKEMAPFSPDVLVRGTGGLCVRP